MSIPNSDAAHLLRRAGFGGTAAEVASLAASTNRQSAVARLLDFSTNPPATNPGLSTTEGLWDDLMMLRNWWLDRMATAPAPLQEKLALFWHGHFACHQDGIYPIGDFEQNQLFRNLGAGKFRPLVQAVSIDPVMLVFLDGFRNSKYGPNQNFSRELMELFTLGVDEYTLDDIREASRAWTGHSIRWQENVYYRPYVFNAWDHDEGMKTFFGITRNWNGPDIVDEICNGAKKPIVARFIARKMWSFFAYPDPEEEVLSSISATFLASDLDIRELCRAIFLHDRFYSTTARQGLVRSPVEFVVAALRYGGLSAAEMSAADYMWDMGQVLFAPPNVAGWKQNGYWLSPSTAWSRASFAKAVREHLAPWESPTFLGDTVNMTVPAAVQAAFDAFGIDQPTANTRANFEAWLTAERTSVGWQWPNQVRNLILLTLLSPEFQTA